MKDRVIQELIADMQDDLQNKTVDGRAYISFYCGDTYSCDFSVNEIDDLVAFLFDRSLNTYIDGFIPYGDKERSTSYAIFLKECDRRSCNTNITIEVIDAMKNFMEIASRGNKP